MSSLRQWTAQAWLAALFWSTRHAAWVPRVLTPVILWGTWRLSPGVRAGTLANARRILGDSSSPQSRLALARGVVKRFFDTVVAFGEMQRFSRAEMLARIEGVDGHERYTAARALRRGAILVTAHLGPFEVAAASVCDREKRVHIVFRRDRSPYFEQLRSDQHRRLGLIEARVDEGLPTWLALREALGRDEVVLMQGDRTMRGQRGIAVPFLGGHMEFPTGPAKLALLTSAPLIPTFAVLTQRGTVRIIVGESIDVRADGERGCTVEEATRRIAAEVEAVVRQYPDQWLILEKAWIEDRAPATKP